jgi:tight adherence protein B
MNFRQKYQESLFSLSTGSRERVDGTVKIHNQFFVEIYSLLCRSPLKSITHKLLTQKERGALLTRMLFICFLIILTGAILKKPFLIGGIFFYLFLEQSMASKKVEKRKRKFEADFPSFINSFTAAIRTGLDPLSALKSIEEILGKECLIAREVKNIFRELESGASEEAAIQKFADAYEFHDVSLFKTSLVLSRKEGSALSPILKRLVKITRQRQYFRKKICSALTMQKVSAFGILLCLKIIMVAQCIFNYKVITETLQHPLGIRLLSIGIIAISVGTVWIINIIKSEF